MSRLVSMLAGTAPIDEISAFLDGLSHQARLDELYALSSKQQRALYERAADAPPLTFEHFVPSHVPDLEPVIHHGKNSLPAFRLFQKRFCRPSTGENGLYGYNEGATRPLIGPGYFVMIPTDINPTWVDRGALVVDYFQVPSGVTPTSWPTVKPNSSGLQRLVYYQTRDFMRRVSAHASIGTAFKRESAMGAYFILCRQD